MKVIIDGKRYDWEGERLLFSEAAFIQKKTGFKPQEWQKALGEFDSFAVAGLVYIIKKRAGEQPDWDTLDFDINSLQYEVEDADEAEDPAPKEGGSVTSLPLTGTS